MLFDLAYGLLFGVPGLFLFFGVIATRTGGGVVEHAGNLLLSIALIAVGGRGLFDALVSTRVMEIRLLNQTWEITTFKSSHLFPRFRFQRTKHMKGAPNWTLIRRGGPMGGRREVHQVRIGNKVVMEFPDKFDASGVVVRLGEIVKRSP